LAAYVIHEVKKTVEGCGLGTDIEYTYGPWGWVVEESEIREMEGAFRTYEKIERVNFQDCVAHTPNADSDRFMDCDKNDREQIRELFSRLTKEREQRF
jgi:hypothetical protein